MSSYEFCFQVDVLPQKSDFLFFYSDDGRGKCGWFCLGINLKLLRISIMVQEFTDQYKIENFWK